MKMNANFSHLSWKEFTAWINYKMKGKLEPQLYSTAFEIILDQQTGHGTLGQTGGGIIWSR